MAQGGWVGHNRENPFLHVFLWEKSLKIILKNHKLENFRFTQNLPDKCRIMYVKFMILGGKIEPHKRIKCEYNRELLNMGQ
jgi:hypothetical protein